MKVFVKGKGEVMLGQSNFVAQGGQASVYQRNGTAYKVYTEPKSAIPEAKFAQLAVIQDGDVVKPEDLLVSGKGGEPIGYTMRFLQDTYSLCQLFTRAFRERHGLDSERIRKLLAALQAHVESVHRARVLVVDLNELNVLVDQQFGAVYMIDVDSFQTRDFKADVIMPSVRDWSVKPAQFSELSDWYSFAVLMCQAYVGIHPYRGKHEPSNTVPADQRLEHRMRANVSIFDRSVAVPKACYPLDAIPAHQREWLKAVLQDGKRLPPPDPTGSAPSVAAQAPRALVFGGSLVVIELASFAGDILAYIESSGRALALTSEAVFLGGHVVLNKPLAGALIGFTQKMGRPVALRVRDGSLELTEFDARKVTLLPIEASAVARSGDRFYLKQRTRVLEIDLLDLPSGGVMVTASHMVADVVEHASRLFDGCVIQSMLGSTFVSLFPRTRAGYQVRVPELDRYSLVDAKFEGGVLVVLGSRQGRYDRLVFRFDTEFSRYDVEVVRDVTPTGVNFTVTHSGVCVLLNEDEKIEAFPAAMGASGKCVVDDPAIGADMRLTSLGGRVGFIRGSKVCAMRLQ